MTEFNRYKPAWVYPDDQVILMQYINIKDLQGKEIYEDDIVETFQPDSELSYVQVVKWNEHRTGFVPISIPDDISEFYARQFKVIGNIYETENYKKLLG